MKINKLNLQTATRQELKDYCDANGIAYRTKDGTEAIRKKAINAKDVKNNTISTIVKNVTTSATNKASKSTKSKKSTQSKDVKYRQIGQNLLLIVDGNTHSLKVADKTDRDKIIQKLKNISNPETYTESEYNNVFELFTVKNYDNVVVKSEKQSNTSVEFHDKIMTALDSIVKRLDNLENIKAKSEKELKNSINKNVITNARTGEKPYR